MDTREEALVNAAVLDTYRCCRVGALAAARWLRAKGRLVPAHEAFLIVARHMKDEEQKFKKSKPPIAKVRRRKA